MNTFSWINSALMIILMPLSSFLGGFGPGRSAPGPQPASSPIPVLAYYYIWFNTNSWDRAKVDYPQLGRYSSDDQSVMLQHIRWAKDAGITGFIVSWKGTDVLNHRLDMLVQLAKQENFKLAIIYQGLDFSRNPLPVSQVETDLKYFVDHYASDPVFSIFSKPMVIWSGTWMFTTEEISQVSQQIRSSILLLASEKNNQGYERLAGLVDGNAYYWSSVNPQTNPNYGSKLDQMASLVHQKHGLWIAPAAPGFDARLIGGTTVVERKNGDTFRTELNTAMASSPDALGIISWNEFSENSYIEPSQTYGDQYLKILKDLSQSTTPQITNFDSSESISTYTQFIRDGRIAAVVAVVVLLLAAFIIIARRTRSA